MAIIQRAILLLIFLAFVHADRQPWNPIGDWQSSICRDATLAQYFDFCKSTTTTTVSTDSTTLSTTLSTLATSSEFTIGVTPTTNPAQPDVTTSSTPLERAHWCRFQNGSTIALGYSFMYSTCAVCQCLQNRAIRCTNLQCMSTFCIDNSEPVQRPGQCCSQCAYENNSNTCTYGTINIPHGTIVKRASTGEQCWCQMGTIECRRVAGSVSDISDLWGSGMGIYLVVIIMVVLLLLGTLTCVGCSAYFYYFYKKQNQTANEEYAQYWNHAGWQPMDGDGQVMDATAEEKKIQAEQRPDMSEYPSGYDSEFIPPPYAINNGPYPSEKFSQ